MTENTRWALLSIVTLVGLSACSGSDDTDSDATDVAETDTTTDAETDTVTDTGAAFSYTISGVVVDLSTGAPLPAGVCVLVKDPDAAVLGGDPVLMGTGQTDATGAFSVGGLTVKPQVGILLSINDCDNKSPTGADDGAWFFTGSPVPTEAYLGVENGGEVPGQIAFGVPTAYKDGVVASLAAAGYAGDAEADGLLFGMVYDAAHTPLSGATVASADGKTVYYQDIDPLDGLFTTAGLPNTSTLAPAGGVWVIPGGLVTNYSATATGFTFESVLAGTDPGRGFVLPFIALP